MQAHHDRKQRGSFRDALEGQGLIFLDGAMGTSLYEKGVFIHRAFEELNLTQPALVREVHAEYLAAGADVLETNTFAANRFRLSAHGLADQVEEINRAGVALAREAAEGRAWVGGAMGPLGARIEPFGHISRDEAREVFRQQAQALSDAGVDLFVLETFAHLPELEEALRAVREVSALPILAQVTVNVGGTTREGVAAAEAAERLVAAGADVIGVNCSEALAALDALSAMGRVVRVPLVGQPNAGQPRSVGGRNLYLASPDYLLAWARRAVRAGVRLLGGCCGTRPEHIRALTQGLGETTPEIAPADVARAQDRVPAAVPVLRSQKSILAAALERGERVLGVELPPTRGWRGDDIALAARTLALAGVHYVSLPEGPPDGAHLPPQTLARMCREAGIEALVQYSCRGRRLARMQSDLLGACAMGVNNLLLVTGVPLNPGIAQDAWPDLEVDSIGAVNLVNRLNHGEDVGNNPVGAPTSFHVAIHVDPTAWDLERERSRLRWKVEAGAELAITAPIFDPEGLGRWLDGGHGIPTIATIWPMSSAREAEFFERRLGSVPVPEPLIQRMREAEDAGVEAERGLDIAIELARAVRPMVQGVQIVAPEGRIDVALAVIQALRAG
ncbi:MAG: bifunctional homocysteine S-methyltransferase/methylenetetrahydrofolate reductase [Deltaproteobacteria bacterium]|nr:bifunctional homocysteine S-methyltransferase/methylenetetrahydrofolate reductase [Deltaproteobacteria bacterium]MCB9786088.1 bifunctional homocysteine S-methyltransferase/methylenetetrahydrofolate reductase [Deltaproteobacteria bacterium]